ncbi:uncharacterized protein LOC115219684 [Argonauta hians]
MLLSVFLRKSHSCRIIRSFKQITDFTHTRNIWIESTVVPNISVKISHQQYVTNSINFEEPDFIPRSKRIRKKHAASIDVLVEANQEKIHQLAEVFSCNPALVEKLIRCDTRILTVVKLDKVKVAFRLLQQAGFSADSIIKYPGIFFLNVVTLQHRLKDMQVFRKYHYSLRYITINRRLYGKLRDIFLKEATLMGSSPTRLSYLAELLQCREHQLQEAIVSGRNFLKRRRLTTLRNVVKLMGQHGITKEDIVNNIDILSLRPRDCLQRLKVMSQPYYNKHKKIEMLKKHRRFFYIMHRVYSGNQQALGSHKDKYEFLQERLACRRGEIELLFIKAPQMRFTSPRRFKSILNLLIDEFGFTPQTIFRNHHLLFFSEKRLRRRWEILENYNLHESDKIADLILSAKKFALKYEEEEPSIPKESPDS